MPGTLPGPSSTTANKSLCASQLLGDYGLVGKLDMNQEIIELDLGTCGLICMTMLIHHSLNHQNAIIFGVCNSS